MTFAQKKIPKSYENKTSCKVNAPEQLFWSNDFATGFDYIFFVYFVSPAQSKCSDKTICDGASWLEQMTLNKVKTPTST